MTSDFFKTSIVSLLLASLPNEASFRTSSSPKFTSQTSLSAASSLARAILLSCSRLHSKVD
uniref:Putative ovule protein n=1 Tax=Solanum chacoense TaxID=4108 RepID=A0A0V0GJ66_SOLCH